MSSGRQTVERRQLGLMLRRYRAARGRSQAETAARIGKDPTHLGRVERGTGSLHAEELTALLDYLDVSGEDRATAMSLAAQARKRQRGSSYTDVLPRGFQRLADLEADATVIYSYEIGIVPGLAQSREYVRALISTGTGVWWDELEQELENRVEFRLDQQRRVLESSPAKSLSIVCTEDALRHVVGGTAVMRGQVLHLLTLAERHAVQVRIVPDGAVDNPLLGGGIIVLEFDGSPRIGAASVAFGPVTYHDEQPETDALLRAFDRTRELALTPDASRDRLITALKEL